MESEGLLPGPFKGSIHNRGAGTLSAASRKTTTIYLFTFEKAKRYKFCPEINLPLSFFLCLLPYPFLNLSPHLMFVYLFSMKAKETAKASNVDAEEGSEFILMAMPAVLRRSRAPRQAPWSLPGKLDASDGTRGPGHVLQRRPPHWSLRTNLCHRWCSSHFKDEASEAQRDCAVLSSRMGLLGKISLPIQVSC